MPSARWRWTRWSRRNPAIPACRWACPTSPPCCSRSFLKFDPADPAWPDRDRFVLSAGHGSMLIYALLYLTGYSAVTLDEIKRFRQLGSKTPGHPENVHHAGRRDHHRPARAGSRQRGRHGDRRAASRRRVRRHRQPQDLRDRVRRRPDGRHQPGGHRARRASEAQQADRAVRRQRHLDRRRAVAVRQRRSGQALRGGGLECLARRRPRCSGDRRGTGKGAELRPPGADRLQDADRLRRADQGRQGLRRTARRSAPTRSRARARRSEWEHEPFDVPDDVLAAWRAAGQRSKQAHADWSKRLAALDAGKRAEFERRMRGRAAEGAQRCGARGEGVSSPPRRRISPRARRPNSRSRASCRRCRR